MQRILKKDKVMVISGRYKGSVGPVLQVLKSENKVIVEGVNRVKKAVKGGKGNYKDKDAPIHLSNVILVDPKSEKPIKVGYKLDKNGIKVRYNKKTGDVIPKPV